MAAIELDHVTKEFAGGVVAVDDVTLTVADGKLWCSSVRRAAESPRLADVAGLE